MILKASQRGGGQDLAAHLMRLDDNEHVKLHELRVLRPTISKTRSAKRKQSVKARSVVSISSRSRSARLKMPACPSRCSKTPLVGSKIDSA